MSFPDPPSSGYGENTAVKARYDAELAAHGKRLEALDAALKADSDSDIALYAKYHEALLEVAKASIDRTRSGADTVQKAAAAIGTLYAGVLGLSFSVAERPLPSRGALPALFLGLALVLSTAYLAYLTRSEPVPETPSPTPTREGAKARARIFINWIRSTTESRASFLRASVLALGFGVAFLPAPFVALGSNSLEPGGASETPWPGEPAEVSSLELQKILYTAQVAEAVAIRTDERAPASDDGNDSAWWAAGALGGLVVAATAARLRQRMNGHNADSDVSAS